MGRARSLAVVTAAVMLAALVCVPFAGAQTSTSPDAQRGALALARETAALAALGGFGRPPNPRITTAVGSLGLAANNDAAQRNTLTAADTAGQTILPAIGNATPDVQRTLGPLGQADLQAATSGRTVSISSEEYLRALDHLLRFNGGPPPAAGPPDPSAIAAALRQLMANPPPATPAGPGATPVPPPTDQPGGPPPTSPATTEAAAASTTTDNTDSGGGSALPLVLAGLVVMAVAGAGVLLLRQQPATAGGPPLASRARTAAAAAATDAPRPEVNAAMQTLLEVSRRLTSEAASGDVDRAVVRHAMEVVRAQGAALVRPSPTSQELLVSTETQPGLLVPDGLADGAVRRVAETGQSLIQVSATEPAIRNLPAALAAVPLVGGGRVEALLIVHGHPAGDAFLKGITNLLSEAVRPASQTPCGPRHPSASRAHGRRR